MPTNSWPLAIWWVGVRFEWWWWRWVNDVWGRGGSAPNKSSVHARTRHVLHQSTDPSTNAHTRMQAHDRRTRESRLTSRAMSAMMSISSWSLTVSSWFTTASIASTNEELRSGARKTAFCGG